MHMRIDHIVDLHPGTSGSVEVDSDIGDRIDHGACRLAAAAEQIRDADRISVKELPENHALPLPCL